MIRPADWRPVGGLKLEPNALSAVTMIDQNVVVAAGPGAGKTELLAQRADFLLRTGACPYPRRILAISFKVDAARNLRDRVRKRSGGQYAARFDSFTFHAFAKRLDRQLPACTDRIRTSCGRTIGSIPTPASRVSRSRSMTSFRLLWRSWRTTGTPEAHYARPTATCSSTSSRTPPGTSTSS